MWRAAAAGGGQQYNLPRMLIFGWMGELVPLSNGARSVALVFRDVLAEGNADV